MSGEQQIKWPSDRIPQGGMFHAPKVEYSKETNDLIKLLMDESKMSMMLKKQINYHLRNGDSLPLPAAKKDNSSDNDDDRANEILRHARAARKKTLDAILASGAYEQEKYRPKPNIRLTSEKAKVHLQETMSGVKSSSPQVNPLRKPKPKAKVSMEPEDRINEILDQINERAQWLAEMEDLGEGRKYRDEIREQISKRLRQIKLIEGQMSMKSQGYRFVE